jgi:uncharacterized repeat protein (TIGR01451 family)
MAGRKRHAAILVLTTTVLAASCAGLHYFRGAPLARQAYRGLTAWLGHSSSEAADLTVAQQLQPIAPTGASSELAAAAASALASTGTQRETTPPAPAPRCIDDDRYAVTPAESKNQEAATQPLRAPAAAGRPGDREPVARGQNPSDSSTPSQAMTADDGFASELSEINPLRPADAPQASPATSSRRAQEAFQANLRSASDDRYSSATSAAEPRSYREQTGESQPLVNPFGSQGASSATGGLSAGAKVDKPISAPPTVQPIHVGGLSEADSGARSRSSAGVGNASGYGGTSLGNRSSLPLTSLPRETRAPAYGDDSPISTVDGTGRPGERAMEGPQRPALELQKLAPAEIQVGKPAKFALRVRNIGARPAEDVTVRDEVPQGTRLVSTTPRADNDASHLVWQLGTLSAGEERTIEVQLMPTAEGEIGSVATVSFATQASAKARCTMPQLAIRMTAPSEVMLGSEQHVKIELNNPGSGDATGVMLYENVPQELRHPSGSTLEFEIGTLRAGETRQLELILMAEKAGKVINALTARADGNIQVEQQVEFEVVAPALQISVDGPSRRYLERQATYQVNVENPGTAVAKDVELVTKLPKGMRFVRANNMGQYDPATHAIYWSLAELPQGERGSVELVAMPVQPGDQTLEVESRAQQGLEDHTSQQVVVEGLAAIMFEVRDAVDPIEVGGETAYEIRVVNQGTKAATNVGVAVALPPGMKATAAESETRYEIQAGGVVFEPLSQLSPKAESIFRVHTQGVQSGDQRVTVEVKSDDFDQPIRREESTRVFGDE